MNASRGGTNLQNQNFNFSKILPESTLQRTKTEEKGFKSESKEYFNHSSIPYSSRMDSSPRPTEKNISVVYKNTFFKDSKIIFNIQEKPEPENVVNFESGQMGGQHGPPKFSQKFMSGFSTEPFSSSSMEMQNRR